mmetsp:Transcript_4061/g.18173  ORF Transcript_4061/g.18173 Transcript_4061/m.18173 type:complete len:500 (+) Transcript_4061:432-1931(+)
MIDGAVASGERGREFVRLDVHGGDERGKGARIGRPAAPDPPRLRKPGKVVGIVRVGAEQVGNLVGGHIHELGDARLDGPGLGRVGPRGGADGVTHRGGQAKQPRRELTHAGEHGHGPYPQMLALAAKLGGNLRGASLGECGGFPGGFNLRPHRVNLFVVRFDNLRLAVNLAAQTLGRLGVPLLFTHGGECGSLLSLFLSFALELNDQSLLAVHLFAHFSQFHLGLVVRRRLLELVALSRRGVQTFLEIRGEGILALRRRPSLLDPFHLLLELLLELGNLLLLLTKSLVGSLGVGGDGLEALNLGSGALEPLGGIRELRLHRLPLVRSPFGELGGEVGHLTPHRSLVGHRRSLELFQVLRRVLGSRLGVRPLILGILSRGSRLVQVTLVLVQTLLELGHLLVGEALGELGRRDLRRGGPRDDPRQEARLRLRLRRQPCRRPTRRRHRVLDGDDAGRGPRRPVRRVQQRRHERRRRRVRVRVRVWYRLGRGPGWNRRRLRA